MPDDGLRHELIDGAFIMTPAITVLELVDGSYVETDHVVGDEVAEVHTPFPIILNPAVLAQG